MAHVALHLGSFLETYTLAVFCQKNRKRLEKGGVIYPGNYDYLNYSTFLNKGPFYYTQVDNNELTCEYELSITEYIPFISFFWNHYFNKITHGKKSFDRIHGNSISAFVTLMRQDLEFECHFTVSNKFIARYMSIIEYINFYTDNITIVNYDSYLSQLESIFGKSNIELCLASTETTSFPTPAQKQFLSQVGVDSDALFNEKAGVNYPAYRMGLPREFLAFEACSCKLHAETNPACCIDKWSTQAGKFTPGSGYVSDGHSLLGPERRATVLTSFAKSNERLARKLGMEQLFPDPDPEPDWEPFLGLTPESAFNVAERLDKDFARDRLLEFESVPSYYRNYEHRICLQALYDAVSDNSRFPFVRTRLEPKVSVLTLSYNHAEFIEDTIKSVIAQRTNFPIQHIIGDDSSDDGTQEIILDYASKYPHIIPVFQQKCSTGWLNIRTLFEMPRTPYVALCDGDDFFTDPEKLQKQVDFLETHKDCALCFHPVRVTYEDSLGGERIYPPPELLPRGIRPFYYLSDLIKCNLMQTNSVMYRWRFVKGLPDWFHSALFPADWYWHLLHAELGKIGFINTIMSVYRRHKNSAYYTAEIDRREHRYKTGFFELHTYRVVNDHFKGDYWNIISSIADGVLADMLVYSSKINDQTLLKEVADEFPLFVSHFLQKVGRARLLPE